MAQKPTLKIRPLRGTSIDPVLGCFRENLEIFWPHFIFGECPAHVFALHDIPDAPVGRVWHDLGLGARGKWPKLEHFENSSGPVLG